MTKSRITDGSGIKNQIERGLSIGTPREEIARELGYSTWRGLVKGLTRRGVSLSCDRPQHAQLPPVHDLKELLEQRKAAFARKQKHEDARRLIPIKMPIAGPYGILWMGDPHVDDDGTDIGLIEQHITIAKKTEGLYLANVGDTTNNWVGRLARLYGEQSTSSEQAWMLAEWMFKLGADKWTILLGGNHDCHDMETEALTRRGWLKADEIKDDDELLSYVAETGECEWAPILGRVSRHHEGELVSIETRSISLGVTPNHRVLCKSRDWRQQWREWGYVPAANLPARVALPVSATTSAKGANLTDEQIALAGWILTDGNISWAGNSPRVTIYQSKDGSRISELLGALGLEHTVSVRHRNIKSVCGRALLKAPLPQTEWRLSASASRSVLSWLPQKGSVPDWGDCLNAKQFSVLLDALVAGDGCWDGGDPESKSVAVLHGTKEFLDSVQALAVRHGWCARISVARGKDWRLNLCRRSELQFESGPATTKRQYSGQVWCFTVPRGNFMVRRNGAAHFSGNCWSGSGDPLRWIAGSINALYQPTEARLGLSQLGTKATIRVNARHDFSGQSQWNPTHAIMKAAQLGIKDHFMVCGHKHISGIAMLKCPDEDLITVCLQLASYKKLDRYAKERAFRDQNISPAALTIIDTSRPANGVITVFHDVEEGADFLKFKRRKK